MTRQLQDSLSTSVMGGVATVCPNPMALFYRCAALQPSAGDLADWK